MLVHTDLALNCMLGDPSPVCPRGGISSPGWLIRLNNGESVLDVLQDGWPFVRPEVLEKLADIAHVCQPSDCPYRCAYWTCASVQEYPHSVVFLDDNDDEEEVSTCQGTT
jgi:hypothetical protein